jgi:hypothetical protein
MENESSAYGVYCGETDVAAVVRMLNSAGFENENICVLLAPRHPIAETVRSAGILATTAAEDSAAAGMIGWLSKLGAVVIPTVGFFIRSRMFFNALVVSTGAPALCGTSWTLSGLGVPDEDADRFEEQLAYAGFLVYVASPEVARSRWAVELLGATGAIKAAVLERRISAEALA